MHVIGLDPDQLATLRRTGVDHAGNPVEPIVDQEGGWPLRCCLTDSRPGDRVAIVAWCPFPWRGPYAETGPVVVHLDDCGGVRTTGVPPQFEDRRQLVRPYTHDHSIAYDLVTIVEPNDSLTGTLDHLLALPEVDIVVVRNVLAGCYSFTVAR